MQVPFLDLKVQYRQIENEVLPMLEDAMSTGMFIGGAQVASFEEEFAAFCNTRFCAGVNSGTDALRFALMAMGIGPGDDVITVPNTFIATTEAISQVGAKPLFVDIDPHTCNMDPTQLETVLQNSLTPHASRPTFGERHKAQGARPKDRLTSHTSHLTPRPKAVIPVHLYGQPVDMDSILALAEKHELLVIEDACQAHGATYKGKKAGSMGAAGCFSFYPGKNLGAFGEGGALVTNDEAMINKIRMIRDHGQAKKYYHDMEGYNGRLDAIQAGVLRIKLKRLADWNDARRENAKYYDELLSEVPEVSVVRQAQGTASVYHLYVILVDNRDELQNFLNEKGIAAGLHYPLPLHIQKAYEYLGYKKGDFPVTEHVADRLLSLPMFPELTHEQIKYVVESTKEFLKK
ncbi:MAG: DegT/DnrJ/EryC1/StrS family aminotransferase [Nitrospinales bacterium]